MLSVLLFNQQSAYGQALNGSVVGNVRDTSEAVIEAAAVTLTNMDTGQSRETLTSSVGSFDFATVQPGAYQLRVNRNGFATHVQTGITVTADNVARVDVTMRVGGVSETIRVESAAAVLQTDSAEVRHELDTADLSKIPVPVGRNYQSLLSTMPGFTPPTNNHSVGTNPSRALYFAVNGGDHYQNNTRIDGATTMNVWLPDIVAMVPTLESIATVNVSTNSFDAETGFTGGANIGVQTKSGANQAHGAAFESHTDNALKARPFFLPSNQKKGKLVYHEFGGAFGGGIVKDKLFYFLSYEGNRDHEYAHALQTTPTAAIKSGDMSGSGTPIYDPTSGNVSGTGRTPFPGNRIPAARIDPIALKISNLLPLPNVPGNPLTNDYDGSGVYTFGRERGDSKINWNPTSKLSSFARFSLLKFDEYDPPGIWRGWRHRHQSPGRPARYGARRDLQPDCQRHLSAAAEPHRGRLLRLGE
jgi:hypothetical protein